MKKSFIVIGIFSFIFLPGCRKEPAQITSSDQLQGSITLSGAWALYPMVVKWAQEFQKIHPQVQIYTAAGGAGKGMADCLGKMVDLGMVSREIYPAEIEKGAWWVSVTKDAVVPTVNADNPAIQDLLTKGVKRDALINIWITASAQNWSQVLDCKLTQPVHAYTRSDACGAAGTWAQYLGKSQEDLQGVGVYGDPGLAEAVKKDPLGIGFNNINYAYDPATKTEVDQIKVLPIDLNENGVIDPDEDFYHDRDRMINAIAVGKYPSPPARPLYLVSNGKPESKVVTEFLKWILTDGQQYIQESGYINLSDEQIAEELEKLNSEK